MTCGCEICILHDRLAEVLKERDEYKRMARLACEIIERESIEVSYADRVQIDVFMSKTGE